MVTPEFRWPTTPTTLASTIFCATVVPTFGSAWSSSATRVNFTSLPSIWVLAAFASSTARRAPFSLSLPKWAMPPVSGPTWPIFTSAPAPPLEPCWPQPMSAIAAAIAEIPIRMFFMRSPRGGSCERSIFYALLLGENPLHERLHVGIGHRGVGRHRHVAPHALASLLDLFGQLGRRGLVGTVLGGNVLVGRSDQLLVHRVAGEAGVLLRELIARLRRPRGQQTENQNCTLHAFSFRASFRCCRSPIGSRQVTPRHSHALTAPGRRGLSSGAGRPRVPSGIASASVSDIERPASARCHEASACGSPRRTTVFGCAHASSSAIAIVA